MKIWTITTFRDVVKKIWLKVSAATHKGNMTELLTPAFGSLDVMHNLYMLGYESPVCLCLSLSPLSKRFQINKQIQNNNHKWPKASESGPAQQVRAHVNTFSPREAWTEPPALGSETADKSNSLNPVGYHLTSSYTLYQAKHPKNQVSHGYY